MKILKTFTLFIVLILHSCGEKPLKEGYYRIDGTVKGLENGNLYFTSNYTKVDTVEVKNGKFFIEKSLEKPVERLMFFKEPKASFTNDKDFLSVYIEPTKMNLELNYEDYSKSNLKGSKTEDDSRELAKTFDEISKKYQKEIDASQALRSKYDSAVKKGATEEELQAIAFELDEANEALSENIEEQRKAKMKFIKENPNSYMSLFFLSFSLGEMKYNQANKIYQNLDAKFKKTELAVRVEKDIENMKKGVSGAIAGDFNTVDINGKPLKLEDFKGKYLLIDFWASWCVPCRKGNPHLISLYNKYNSKGLEILGVSDDDRAIDKWKKAVEKDGIGIWHHVLRGYKVDKKTKQPIVEEDITRGYNVTSYPTKILVNPEGIVIGRYGGGGETDEVMDKDLAKLFEASSK